MACFAIEEKSGAARNKVNFISRVWLLRVTSNRCIKLNDQRAMRKDGNGKIAGRWWTFFEGVSQGEDLYC